MFRNVCLKQAISNIQPHIKNINSIGINSRNVIFNPRYSIFNIVYQSSIKLHSKNKNRLIRIQDHPKLALMELYVLFLDLKQVENHKILDLSVIVKLKKVLIGEKLTFLLMYSLQEFVNNLH